MSNDDVVQGEVMNQSDEAVSTEYFSGEEERVEITDELRAMFEQQSQQVLKHPSGVECIEVARHMSFNLGNVMNHIWNDGLPGHEVGLDSLKQAQWYLQDEINYLTAREESAP